MSRLRDALAPGRALLPYLTAGDPSPEAFLEAALGAAEGGASAIEVGIPFSDPVADGPVIQQAHHRALQAGGGVASTLELVADFRTRSSLPLVLFTYLNPVLAHGVDRFAREARDAGADGLLVLDLSPEEEPEWCSFVGAAGLDPIVLDSPNTSPSRIRALTRDAGGFLYVVSRDGVTGTHAGASGSLERRIAGLRTVTDLPLAVGFGVSTPEDVASIWNLAECAVVGSAFVGHLQRQNPSERRGAAQTFVRHLLHPAGTAQENLP